MKLNIRVVILPASFLPVAKELNNMTTSYTVHLLPLEGSVGTEKSS